MGRLGTPGKPRVFVLVPTLCCMQNYLRPEFQKYGIPFLFFAALLNSTESPILLDLRTRDPFPLYFLPLCIPARKTVPLLFLSVNEQIYGECGVRILHLTIPSVSLHVTLMSKIRTRWLRGVV